MPRYSIDRPEHYVPVLVDRGPNKLRLHHCHRSDCEWYYDGSTAKRAMLPRKVKSYTEQNNVKDDPPGQPGYWNRLFLDELRLKTKDEARRGSYE